MRKGMRFGFTAAEKAELWDRWQRGEAQRSIVDFRSCRCGSGSYRCPSRCATVWPTIGDSPAMSWAFLYVFIRALFGELRRRAERLLNLRSTQCGAVTFVQRFGDALNANVHFYSMMIDGVYAADGSGRPRFHQLPAPEDPGVLRLTFLVSERVRSMLERRGLGTSAEPQQADPLSEDDPGMAALLASSVSRRIAVGSNAGHGVKEPVVEVCRVALRAPWGQMQGVTTTSMLVIWRLVADGPMPS